jgi:hypothetical protein
MQSWCCISLRRPEDKTWQSRVDCMGLLRLRGETPLALVAAV